MCLDFGAPLMVAHANVTNIFGIIKLESVNYCVPLFDAIQLL